MPRPDQSRMAVPKPDGGCRPRLARLGSRVLVCSLVWLACVSVHQAAAQVVSNIRVSSALATDSDPDVAISGDHLVAVWVTPGATNAVRWGSSVDGGNTWTQGGTIPLNAGEQAPGRESVTADRHGNFYCAGLLQVGSGYLIAVYRGAFSGGGFAWTTRVTAIPVIPFSHDWPDIIRLRADPQRDNLYLTYTDVFGDIADTVFFTRSTDGGTTWSAPLALASPMSNGTCSAMGPDGELYVAWEDFGTSQIVGRKSVDGGATFGPSFAVASIVDNLTPQPPGWYRNVGRENPRYPIAGCTGPGFPRLAVDTSPGPRRGTVYAVWPERATGVAGADLGSVTETEPNSTFATATPVAIGQSAYGFMQSADIEGDCDKWTFTGTAGTTVMITGVSTTSIWPYHLYCGDDPTAVAWEGCGFLEVNGNVPPFVYTLPATGRYYIDMGCTGASAVHYRLDLRELEIDPSSVARDHRDIVMVKSTDRGATWSGKVRVNDDAPLYDDALPNVAVDAHGEVHVAWYDRREQPQCSKTVNTYWSHSDDGGASFAASRRLSEQPTVTGASIDFGDGTVVPGESWRVGDHLAVEAAGEKVYVLWSSAYRDTVAQTESFDIQGVIISPDTMATAVLEALGFRGEGMAGGVRLRWEVEDAAGVQGFRLYRAADASPTFEPLEEIAVRGQGEYQYEDRGAQPGHAYRYRLEMLLAGGGSRAEVIGPLEPGIRVSRLMWGTLAPNPSQRELQVSCCCRAPGCCRCACTTSRGTWWQACSAARWLRA